MKMTNIVVNKRSFFMTIKQIDQGAYTCEAINVKGRVLATPDCIVRIVNIPAPVPPTRPPALTRCDPRGSVYPQADRAGTCTCKRIVQFENLDNVFSITQRDNDLFNTIFKPLVTGPACTDCYPGSFHLNEKSPQGCLKCFCFGITDNCRSSNLYRTQAC
ncbi:hypothetical protein DICVIV_14289 [Dictyocaulus viviparus]|uniref:Immunoglobulin I-set domain protein n=1 Tax=Dictyocaulus viviparus TaxID=29172 RepID=A0A0D8X5R1_DICVI|nr:hypothetical protein DICVIV_14289 [Dictyocaulus viviparus]